MTHGARVQHTIAFRNIMRKWNEFLLNNLETKKHWQLVNVYFDIQMAGVLSNLANLVFCVKRAKARRVQQWINSKRYFHGTDPETLMNKALPKRNKQAKYYLLRRVLNKLSSDYSLIVCTSRSTKRPVLCRYQAVICVEHYYINIIHKMTHFCVHCINLQKNMDIGCWVLGLLWKVEKWNEGGR